MNGKGKMRLKIGKVTVTVTYRYENLTEETINKFNKMLAKGVTK